MTRERASDYDSKRALILAQAARLFADVGFDVTTMIDVAKACSASKSHVYHYFPGKEDLLFEIVHEHTRVLLAELEIIVAEPLPADQRFARFIAAFVARAADSRNEHLVLTTSLKYLPPERSGLVRDMESRITQLLVGLLEAINPDRMRPKAVRGPYAFLMFGMLIWTFTWYDKAGTLSPQALAAMMTDLFLNGFADHPSAMSSS
jgi:AcrR family transcriptional regulator